MPTTRAPRKSNSTVQFAVPRRGVPGARSLRAWAASVAAIPVTLRVVGRSEGRRLNREFRKKDYATNVLSFHSGDIVLCHPVIAREARDQGKAVAAHYAHLVVHGVLHLRGYDHKNKSEAARMARAERRILARLGFADPYAVKSPLPR